MPLSRMLAHRNSASLNSMSPLTFSQQFLFYYKLTNFFQNHRRYVKSLNSDQLKGKAVSSKTLDNSDCKPLSSIGNRSIYPCGLIANSLFNGMLPLIIHAYFVIYHFQTHLVHPTLLNPTESNPSQEYAFSFTGIAWPGESKKYVSNPVPGGYASYADIVPPPNWALRFPNGYTNSTPPSGPEKRRAISELDANSRATPHLQSFMEGMMQTRCRKADTEL